MTVFNLITFSIPTIIGRCKGMPHNHTTPLHNQVHPRHRDQNAERRTA